MFQHRVFYMENYSKIINRYEIHMKDIMNRFPYSLYIGSITYAIMCAYSKFSNALCTMWKRTRILSN